MVHYAGRERAARRGWGAARTVLLALAVGLTGCLKSVLLIDAEVGGSATLRLSSGAVVTLTGPAELRFLCRPWGDSYFEVGSDDYAWTCSGGKLSDNGVKLGSEIIAAAVRAALASTGAGAAGTGAGLVMDSLAKRLRGIRPVPEVAP